MMPKTKGFRSVSNVIQDPRGGPVGVTTQGPHDSENRRFSELVKCHSAKMRSFDIDQYIINVQYNGRNMNNESGFVIGRDIILINLRRKSPKECNFF